MFTNMMGKTTFYLAPDVGVQTGSDDGKANVTAEPENGVNGATESTESSGAMAQETSSTTTTQSEAKQNPAWMAQLPNDLKNDPALAKYRTVGDLAKALKETESKATEDAKQAEDSAKEEVSEVKYENFTKKLNEDIDPYGTISNGLVEDLQKLGISQDKAEKILEAVEGKTTDAYAKLVQDGIKHTEETVRKLWGRDYEKNRALMARGYQAIKDEDGSLQKKLDSEGASCSPAVWELLSRVGSLVAEDKASASNAASAAARDFDAPPNYPN